ncbi:hypothetical protein XENOCAPTIV_026841, partial [Xenoophorus captivus]
NIAIFVKPVNVSRGDRVVLTTDVLLATDGTDKPEELLYVITNPPAHGHIEYIKHPGVIISTFSQMDIAANLVPQGCAMILGPDCLLLSDPDTPPRALTFFLRQPPQYGKLLLAGVTLTAGSNFTQEHIKELEVIYRHDGGPSQIDRFAFTASDTSNRGFLLDGELQTEPVFFTIQVGDNRPGLLEFRWSRVEFSWPQSSLCEERGQISLDIIRMGNLAESSYVTVKV